MDQRSKAGPLRWTPPTALSVCVADPDATLVALSGGDDYDFQFLTSSRARRRGIPAAHVR